MTRRMLYFAGPYTNPDPVENTHRVVKAALATYEDMPEWVPFIPHLSLLAHIVVPRDCDYWYDLDIEQMRHCDAIVRLPGASTGADREMKLATAMGLQLVPFESLPERAQRAWKP